MTTGPFKQLVSSPAELTAIVGEPAERSVKKETARLDGYARAFIAHSPLLLLRCSTTGRRRPGTVEDLECEIEERTRTQLY